MLELIQIEKSIRKRQQYTALDSMFDSSALQSFGILIHVQTKNVHVWY